ncbi:MAG: DNA translocase FtsK 4TM domain-containing protein [Bacteroidales bacterium]|nr:MAG: DNA translocase FtsK 4TM domain-containing protein [Bacteroidales bacterium]
MGRKKKSNNNRKRSGSSILKDERFKFTVGLIITCFSILIFLSLISYLFTWKIDQSFECNKVFSGPDVSVHNWAGKTGACFAKLLIYRCFGIASFSIPFLILIIGLALLKIKFLHLGRTFRISIVATIILSAWLGFIFKDNNELLGYGLGGKHGSYVSGWLIGFIGNTGTIFVLLISTFAFILFSFRDSFAWLRSVFMNTVFKTKKASYPETEETQDETDEIELDIDDKSEDLVFETEFPLGESAENNSFKKNTDLTVDESNPVTQENGEEGVETDELINIEELEDYDPTLELSNFKLPSLDLLEKYDTADSNVTEEELVSNKNKIVETLAHYKIKINKIKATIGPAVTLYEIVPAPGVRISRIKSLEDDIALNLAALGIRIIAPIPGRGTIGIEVPNQNPEIVSIRSILSSRKYQDSDADLTIALGKTISNETYVFDLTKMPHLLVAGATGQGKSVGLNTVIASLLFKNHPSKLKLVLIDPKKVELTLYSRIEKHYLAKVPDIEDAIINGTQNVIYTLNSLTVEMDQRYDLLKKAQVRNISEYNHKFISRQLNPEKGHRYLPYIVVIIDEFADLIMIAGKEVEMPLARLAQLARAIGIHLVIATQRPTTNIITGIIKANFPARMAFRVTSMIDSRTIIDSPGANQLVGRGDMLFAQGNDMIRLQCAFIDIPEIERITDYIGSQQGFTTAMYLPEYVEESAVETSEVDLSKRDSLFNEAARLVVIHQQGSTSLIQRKFSIGYNRAGRIIDQLEAAGIVGPFEGSKARQVLFSDEYSLEQFLNSLDS